MRAAACVLIEGDRDGFFLAISRRNDNTKWGMPGGKIDGAEGNVHGAVRELREETGLRAEAYMLEPLFSGLALGEVNFWVTTYLWLAGVNDAKLKPEEGMELKWVTREVLCDPTMSPFAEYNVLAFSAFDARKKGF